MPNLAIHEAISAGDLDELRALIDSGEDIETPNSLAIRPLHWACRADDTAPLAEPVHLAMATMLLQCGADTNTTDYRGRTPLHYACISGFVTVVEALVRSGSRIHTPGLVSGESPIHLAASGGFLDTVKFLVTEAGADVHQRTRAGYTPLHLTANAELARWLVTISQANPYARDAVGSTPLHHACLEGRDAMAAVLVAELGVDPNIRNDNGETALHKACDCNHTQLVQWLVTHAKVDVNAKGADGWTALHIAANRSNTELVLWLVNVAGAVTEAFSSQDRHPLACVRSGVDLQLLKVLITEDTDIDRVFCGRETEFEIVRLAIPGSPTTPVDVKNELLAPQRRERFCHFSLGRHARTGQHSPVRLLVDDVMQVVYLAVVRPHC